MAAGWVTWCWWLLWVVAVVLGAGTVRAQSVTPLPPSASPSLSAAELILENGASGAITLQLPGASRTAQTYVLQSSRPDVLQVPARVTLPAGASAISLPVVARAPGVALLRVLASTRQLSATVRIIDDLAQLQAVQPQPATVVQSAQARLRLELTAVVRADTAVDLFASAADVLDVPAQVVVPAGSRSVEVPVGALAPGIHTVSAQLYGQTLQATFRVTDARPAALSLLPSRTSVEAGASVGLTVQLSGHTPAPVDVALGASPAGLLELPPTVRVPAGADRVDVQARALAAGTAQVLAQAGARSAAASVVVRAPVGAATVPAFNLRPPSLSLQVGASGQVVAEVDTVRAYDQVVTLSVTTDTPASGQTGPVLLVQPSLVVPAGQRTARFQVTGLVPGSASVNLRMLNNPVATPLTVVVSEDSPRVTGLEPASQALPRGSTGKAVVRVAPGGAEQTSVTLSSENPAVVSLPAEVRMPAGQTEADVPLTALAEGETQISASLNGGTASVRILVTPPSIEELRPPAAFRLGLGDTQALPVTALLTDGSVADNPAGLQISSDQPGIVTVNADGSLTGVTVGQTVLTVTLGSIPGGIQLRVPVSVVAQPRLALSPATAEVTVGDTVAYTVTSSAPAPADGLVVQLSYSGAGGLDMPLTVTMPASATSVAFTVRAVGEGAVTVQATATGWQAATASLNKVAPVVRFAIESVSPLQGGVGTVITLDGVGFDPVAANNQVFIGAVRLEVVSATASQIFARVPVQAVTGVLIVVNSQGTATGPTFTVQQAQDASLLVTPNGVRLLRGSEATVSLSIGNQGAQPYTGSMALRVSGLPSGVTAQFDPQTLPAERTGTLRLQSSTSVSPGVYSLIVTGMGNATSGRITRTATLSVTVPDPEQTPSTGVRGRFLTPEGQPIAGVIVRADTGGQNSPSTTTDASGAFELAGLNVGATTLRFDATPANPLYPIWPFSVTVERNQMLVLKDFVIAPPPEPATFSAINNATSNQTITDGRFPGLEITLPAGVEIVGWDGVRKTQIAVEKRDISELPVPPPPVPTGTAYQLYFGTPMGGVPSQPIPISLPNDTGAEPGESVNVWFFDGSPLGGTGEWKIAGQAVVSADGKVARMVSGGLTRFCGVCGLACLQAPPKGDDPGKGCPKSTGGNPVNLFSGQELTQTGGLTCGGQVPVETGRNYNPIDAFNNIGGTEGSLGYGWALDYDAMFLDGSVKRLVMPGNVDHVFGDEGGGNYRNRTEPRFDGAVAREVSGNWQITYKDGSVWRFQPFAGAPGLVRGQPQFLVEVRDPNGRVMTVTRNTRGQLLSVGSAERRITASYGGNGFIDALTDPEGRTERFTYTASNRIAIATDPDGRETRYTYVTDAQLPTDPVCSFAQRAESGERLRTISYPGLTNPTENFYGSGRRILRQTTATGLEYQFNYRVGGACITNTATPGTICSGPTCPTEDNWANYQAGWRFHGGQVLATTVINPDGVTTTARFGSQGQLLESSSSAGNRMQYQRDAQNRTTRMTDVLGRVTRMTYDEQGNVARSVDALGRVTEFTYDSRWNKPATVTRYADDGTAQTWRFTYDSRGNLATTTNPLGHRVTLGYSALGQLTSVTDPLSQVTRLGYNSAGDLIEVTDPLQNRTLLETDRSGRSTGGTDALGYSTSSQTNGIGLTTEVLDAIGGTTRMAYDEGARLTSVTNPRGNAVASHSYDMYGRLAARTDANNQSDTYRYDSAGRVESVVDRKGQTTRYVYDAAGRSAQIEFPDRTRSFTYDGADRVVTVEEGSSRVDYEYDTVNRLVKEVQTNGATSHEVSYGYDRLDRRVWRRVNGAEETRYEWDLADRLTAIRFAGESTLYEWDNAGRLTRKTLPNGVTADHAYDAASRLLSITYRGTNGVQIERIDYTYDARGMRTSKALVTGGVIPDTPINATYDAADRMTSVTFTATGETCSLSYDANGSLATKDCGTGRFTAYSWDGLDRLVAIQGPGLEASFAYDVMGRRTARTLNGVTTAYVYDDVQMIGEISATSRIEVLSGLVVDELIAAYSVTKNRVAMTDAQMTVLAELRADGTSDVSAAYSVYGEVTRIGSDPVFTSGYTGRELDSAGLMFYRARHYDPRLKRFLSEDRIGLEAGLGSYQYVNGRPTDLTDPTGEIGVGGALFGAGVEVGIQMLENYYKGCDIWDGDNYDWWDVGVSAAVGAVAPGWLAVGKKSLNSRSAISTLSGQLGRARTANRINKIQGRINQHKGQIKEIVGTQLAWQGAKALGKTFGGEGAGSGADGCGCKK
ncbi:MAG: RHS repeat-associated core domain-containing protein [Methyloversatilis sp.]|nr:RHS repeat-associated core domain-containing protein [Methyloversatilis sp.]